MTGLGRGLLVLGVLAVALVDTASAQTPDEIDNEPIVKQRAGATRVPAQCLTREELDLIAALNALRRPTVGVEGPEGGDDPAPFDPHYFVGTWEFEGVLPESPLGEAGAFTGTETVTHVEGCTYESVIDATLESTPITVRSLMVYDRPNNYLVRIEDDSRGFQLVKVGALRGDPGGYFSHHWEAPAIEIAEAVIRLRGRTYLTSPDAYRLRMQIAVDGHTYVNFGTVWWERVITEP